MDDEIFALESRRCKWDKDVIFTKRGLIDHIEKVLAENNAQAPDAKK